MPILQCCRLGGRTGIRHNRPCQHHLRCDYRKPPLHWARSLTCCGSGCKSRCDSGCFTRCGSCYDPCHDACYDSSYVICHDARYDFRNDVCNDTCYGSRSDSCHDSSNSFSCGSSRDARCDTSYGSSNDVRCASCYGISYDSNHDSSHFTCAAFLLSHYVYSRSRLLRTGFPSRSAHSPTHLHGMGDPFATPV
jgi:hypothetical protein